MIICRAIVGQSRVTYTDTSREIDRLSRDKLSMPPGMKGILCIKFDLFKIKNTDFWAAYGMTSLLRVADAETKDRDIFGRGSGFRYFTMCDRHTTYMHCHTARLDMIKTTIAFVRLLLIITSCRFKIITSIDGQKI